MENFPGNTNKDKKTKVEKPKIEAVVKNKPIQRKKPLGKRLTETFVGGDAKGVWSYIFMDVLVPAAKDMVVDATSQGVERMIFGEVRSGGRRPGKSSYTSYNRYSTPSRGVREESRAISRRGRATHDFDEIILGSRSEAEEVLDRLFALLSQYEMATVADLYDLVDLEKTYMDDKWGWTDLRGAGATRVRNGYLLDLPRPESLD